MIVIKVVKTIKNSKSKIQKNKNIIILHLYTVKRSLSYCIEARVLLLWHILQQLIYPNRRIAI